MDGLGFKWSVLRKRRIFLSDGSYTDCAGKERQLCSGQYIQSFLSEVKEASLPDSLETMKKEHECQFGFRSEPESGKRLHREVQMGKKWMIILIVLTAGIVVAVGALGIGKNKKKTQMTPAPTEEAVSCRSHRGRNNRRECLQSFPD